MIFINDKFYRKTYSSEITYIFYPGANREDVYFTMIKMIFLSRSKLENSVKCLFQTNFYFPM